MKPKVFLTRELPPKCMERLHVHTDLTYNQKDRVLSKAEIIEGVRGQDGLLCLLTDQIDGEIMDANPDLKIIANYAVGFNNIDVSSATERRLPVTNTPGVLTDTSADMAFTLLVSTARRIVEGDNFLRSGQWNGWGPLQFLGADIYGATLGIIGLGRIGKAVAKRGTGFDMKIIYWNRTRLSEKEEEALGLTYASFEDVLRQSDFVSINVAYNQDTFHLISEKELDLMKETAILINTARGPVVDEKALVHALQNKKIAGAGLDVYEEEPKVQPELMDMQNCVLLPHLASATIATRTRMGMIAIDNLLAKFNDLPLPNLVNEEILK
jgi:glyoxylate reductase